MPLTTGAYFLLTTGIPTLLGPPLVLHALLVLISQIWPGLTITTTVLACNYLFALPTYNFVSIRIVRFKEARAARRLGARIAPRLEGFLPGNIDILYQGISAAQDEYFGGMWLRSVKDHGMTFTISVLGDTRICTVNPANIQKVLATDFELYCKGELYNESTEALLGVGVFNSDGDMWQFHRKMTRPFFSKERVTDLVLYERKAELALEKMQERFDAGLAVDFQDLVSRFTLDSACEFLLGTSTNSLDSPLAEPYSSATQATTLSTPSTRFARAFSAALVILLGRIDWGPLWPLTEVFQDKLKQPMKEIKAFIDPIVRNAITKREQGGTKDGQSLLGHLLEATDDMKIIVDETLNILLAGRDTTASLLTFVTYCLAMNPEALSRLRQEILSTIGSTRPPTYDDLRDMKYLRAVLNETLRLFPPVPNNMRETKVETTWLDDEGGKFYVPANTRLVYSVFHLHRNEKYWGSDAHVFDPDRWLDSRIRYYTANPFIFIPFNAGPRICIGQQFAYHETSFFLVRLLQRFDQIELAPECQPPNTRPPESWKDPTAGSTPLGKRRLIEKCFPRAHLTLYSDGGLWIRAKRAETNE